MHNILGFGKLNMRNQLNKYHFEDIGSLFLKEHQQS